jgi:hypothetical protein
MDPPATFDDLLEMSPRDLRRVLRALNAFTETIACSILTRLADILI